MIYFFPNLIIFITAVGIVAGGWAIWIGFVFFFGIYPLLELLFQKIRFEPKNFDSEVSEWSLYLMPFVLTVFLFVSLTAAAQQTQFLDLFGIVLSAGCVLGGFGITSSHELVHRRERWQRGLGVYNLMLTNFAHYGIEHVVGHHKYVATPEDPATARKNESVYFFWMRCFFGALHGAYKIDSKKILFYSFVSAALSTAIYMIWGMQTVLTWWAISAVAILLLQTVDYIEHYGLVRGKNQDGFYLAFKPQHAWDSASVLTNIMLYNLGFHSHHHAKATVKFQQLDKNEAAMKMPFGYSVMVILALVPMIYIPMMNRKLQHVTGQK